MKLVTSTMTRRELVGIIEQCQAELDSRKKQEQEELIENFQRAYFALKDRDIKIRYDDYKQEAYRILLNDWENFEFGD